MHVHFQLCHYLHICHKSCPFFPPDNSFLNEYPKHGRPAFAQQACKQMLAARHTWYSTARQTINTESATFQGEVRVLIVVSYVVVVYLGWQNVIARVPCGNCAVAVFEVWPVITSVILLIIIIINDFHINIHIHPRRRLSLFFPSRPPLGEHAALAGERRKGKRRAGAVPGVEPHDVDFATCASSRAGGRGAGVMKDAGYRWVVHSRGMVVVTAPGRAGVALG